MNSTTNEFLQPLANSTDGSWKLKFGLVNVTVMLFLALLALTGNCLTLAAFIKFEALRTSRYMLIASLAVADAVVGVSFVVFVITGLLPGWCPRTLGTILLAMAVTLPIGVSHVHVILMAIERCIAVTSPFSQWMSNKRRISLITSTWLFGIIYASTLLSWGWEDKQGARSCIFSPIPPRYTTTAQVLLCSLVALTVITIYGYIWRVAKNHKTRIDAARQTDTSSNNAQNSVRDSDRSGSSPPKATMFITAVVGVYLGTWVPYLGLDVISLIEPRLTASVVWIVVMQIAFDLVLSNSCLNILVYAVYIKDFRKAYKSILSCSAYPCSSGRSVIEQT